MDIRCHFIIQNFVRIREVKKITKKRFHEVSSLKERLLNKYGEDWRIIPKYSHLEEEDDKSTASQPHEVHVAKEEKVNDCMLFSINIYNLILYVQFQMGNQSLQKKSQGGKFPSLRRTPMLQKDHLTPSFNSVRSRGKCSWNRSIQS